MSSGIFGPRAPAYSPSYSHSHSYPSYSSFSSYLMNGYGYRSTAQPYRALSPALGQVRPAYPLRSPLTRPKAYQVQSLTPVTPQPLYPSYAVSAQEVMYPTPYAAEPGYVYYPLPQTEVRIPEKRLAAILVAILILVSLDLVFVRPLKQNR